MKSGVYAEKIIEQAQKCVLKLAKKYDVSPSCVVWMGDNKYIIIKDGKQYEKQEEG